MDNMTEILGKKYNVVIYYEQKKWIRFHIDVRRYTCEKKDYYGFNNSIRCNIRRNLHVQQTNKT